MPAISDVVPICLRVPRREIAYVKGRIQAMGVKALVLDAGILGEPLGVKPDMMTGAFGTGRAWGFERSVGS